MIEASVAPMAVVFLPAYEYKPGQVLTLTGDPDGLETASYHLWWFQAIEMLVSWCECINYWTVVLGLGSVGYQLIGPLAASLSLKLDTANCQTRWTVKSSICKATWLEL